MRWFLAALLLLGLAVAEDEVAAGPGVQTGLIADLLILFGCIFILAGAVGMLRFPDFYTRLHAATKLVTVGGLGLFGGAALAFAGGQATGRVLLIAGFFFLTAPLSGYMIARAGYLRGLTPYREEGSVDEWGAKGAVVTGLPQSLRPLKPDDAGDT
jgi:multicomponent Na+:H+ antiporter subunit G